MNREVVVTCAVTGSGDTVGKHPAIPVTPEQIAAAAIEAARAGAAVAHVHVRDPQSGKAARRLELYREVVQRVRASGVDVILNLTAGMGGDYVPEPEEPWRGGPGTDMASVGDRLVHVEELRPEICTLDCGSMNYAASAYVSTPDMLRAMAARVHTSDARVRQWMTENPITAPPDMTFDEASEIMLEKGFRHLPVVDGESILGIVSLRRIMGGRRPSSD